MLFIYCRQKTFSLISVTFFSHSMHTDIARQTAKSQMNISTGFRG